MVTLVIVVSCSSGGGVTVVSIISIGVMEKFCFGMERCLCDLNS